MIKSSNILFLLSTLLASQVHGFSVESSNASNRRTFLSKAFIAAPAIIVSSTNPLVANAGGTGELVDDLKTSLEKIQVIPGLLDQGEWDKVRTVLKTPPVNKLWNLGDTQNTLVKLAKESGEFELLELKDELSISLQICDQLTYDNAFVYFQPGNGKVKIKEPKDLAFKAMDQIKSAIELAGN